MNLFSTQMDFIHFLFGLAFFIVATMLYFISKFRQDKSSWVFLSSFCLLQGIAEWLVLSTIFAGTSPSLLRLILIVEFLSYFFLFEFGRKTVRKLAGKGPGAWVYIPLLVLSVSGIWFGFDGFSVSSRLFIGLSGALFAAYSIFLNAGKEPQEKIHLLLLSIIFVVYGIAIGFLANIDLLNNYLQLFPSIMQSNSVFWNVFEPIRQLLKGVLIILLTGTVFLLYNMQLNQIRQSSGSFSKHNLGVVSILAVIIMMGWYGTGKLWNFAFENHKSSTSMEISAITEFINVHLMETEDLCNKLSGSPWVSPALIVGKDADITHALSVFERYKESGAISDCHLLDKNGDIVVSSRGFLGKNVPVHLASYINEISEGWKGRYFTYDPLDNEKIFYTSVFVRRNNGELLGRIVVGRNLAALEGRLQFYPYCFLVDPNGVIFLSNNNDLTFRSLWPIDMSTKLALEKTGKYGGLIYSAIFTGKPQSKSLIRFNNDQYYLDSQTINNEGWAIVRMNKAKAPGNYRLFGIALTFFAFLVAVVIFIILDQSVIVSYANDQRKAVLDSATQIAIIGTNPDGLITVFNTGAEKMLGYKTDEVILKQTPIYFHLLEEINAFLGQRQESYGNLLNASQVANIFYDFLKYQKEFGEKGQEWSYLRKDGSVISVNIWVSTQYSRDNSIVGYLFIAEDITERKRVEKESERLQGNLIASEKMAALGQLAAGVAHEINNPLTSILGFAQVILKELGKDSKHHEDLIMIENAAMRCKSIVQSLMAYASQDTFKMVPLDIPEVIDNTLKLFDRQVDLNQISIIKHYDLNVPAVNGNQVQLEQVFMNIFMNSRDAMTNGGVLDISVKNDGAGHVEIVVSDTGVGIPREILDKIFDPFFTTKTVGKGSGIGLSSSFGIIQVHGGTITAASNVGQGTSFTIILPVGV